MKDLFSPEQRRDLLVAGSPAGTSAGSRPSLTAGAALPFYNEAALAQGLSAVRDLPPDAVKINANENPMGPCPEAIEAIQKLVPLGGRYLYDETFTFADTMAAIEGLPQDHVLPFAGSSDPLHRVVLAFTGPEQSFVVADPGYEAGGRAAQFVGAKTFKVPLRKDWSHDVRAMAAADPERRRHLRLQPQQPDRLAHAQGRDRVPRRQQAQGGDRPPGRGVHPPVEDGRARHADGGRRQGRDHPPDLLEALRHGRPAGRGGARASRPAGEDPRLRRGRLPATGMVGATASLKAKGLVESRRKIIADIREETVEWLEKKGFDVIPSEANMIMIDVRRPGREVFAGDDQGEGGDRPELAGAAEPRAGHDRNAGGDGEVPDGVRATS